MQEQKNKPTQRINPRKLYEILERQTALANEFLQILSEEKAALTEMDVHTLSTLSKKKEHQVTRIQRLDATMQEEAQRLRPDLAGKIVKIDALTPVLTPEEAELLTEHKERLTGLRDEILHRNLFNKQFAEDTRKYLDDAIQLITGAMSDSVNASPMYSTRGTTKQLASQPSLLSREV